MSKIDLKSEVVECQTKWQHKLLIGTPTTGMVRIEWVLARYGQVIPTNWSHIDYVETMKTVAPLRYSVSDAQNIIVQRAVEQEVEWLLLIESDNVLPPDTFIRLNDYMRKRKIPVVSGLYFTKSDPPEPMVYRKMGGSFYINWKLGDKVWCWGIPTGTFLCHMSIMRALWNDSPEYRLDGQVVRRVFDQPAKVWFDPQTGLMRTDTGTSDLAWCDRVIKGKYLEQAGWPEIQRKKYPFLVDTNIFVKHIDTHGRIFPLAVPREFLPEKKLKKTRKR